MIVFFYILALCYARGGVCVMEDCGQSPVVAQYRISSQLCSMTQVMENITTGLGAYIVVKDSTFVFDYDLPIPCDNQFGVGCLENFNDISIRVDNSIIIFNTDVNIRRIEFESGSLQLYSDIHVQVFVLDSQVQDFFNSIIPNGKIINYYEMNVKIPYGFEYNVPSEIKFHRVPDTQREITAFRTCPEYRPLENMFDSYCPDVPVITNLYLNTTTSSPTCSSQTAQCPECNCPVCQECQECQVCEVCQECPVCPVCQECEVCEVCQQCPECNCPDCPQPVCPQPEEPSKTITITIGRNPNNQVIATYDDESDDKRGIVWMNNEVLFVFQATYNRYSIDGYNKEWYYIKNGKYYILPRYLVMDIVMIKTLSLSKQFNLTELTYKSTSDGFYILYDDMTFDIMVKKPYDVFNFYTLNKDGFTYKFTTFYTKRYKIGDIFMAKVIADVI